MSTQKTILLIVVLCLLSAPLALAYAATAGSITGVVTDPKGAVVAGAAVTVTDPVSNQNYTATTDKAGRYKVEGLPAGVYTVTIAATGFTNIRRENVKVEDDKAATIDAKLEIAAVETQVNVSANSKPNTDSVYQQLRNKVRDASSFGGPYAKISNLVLKRDAATFTLKSGNLYFLDPVENRVTGGVFIGEGEVTVTPPNEIEKKSLTIFTDEPVLTEQFTQLVLRFTDKTFDEIKASSGVTMSTGGPEASRAREAYLSNQDLFRKEFRYNIDLRTLMDIYAPTRPGYFAAFINGKRYSKLVYQIDPLGIPEVSPDEVGLLSYGQSDGGYWTSFLQGGKFQKGTPPDHRLFDITHHEIDAVIRGTQLTATDQVTFSALSTRRVLPFNLFNSLRVSSVTDSEGHDVDFIQESKDEDADFAIIMPKALELGKTYTLNVQYQGGDALLDLGGGNFFLNPGARETWYPNNGGTSFGDRAVFSMTFHYSKGNMLVATGDLEGVETPGKDNLTAKWTSGQTELAVAGFNYGKFKKKETKDPDTGYNVEVFTNTQLAPDLQERNTQIRMIENQTGQDIETLTGGAASSTSGTTSAGAGGIVADTQNALRIYERFFGKLPYSHLAMTQQPAGFFGQAWPTLVYMPYTAFLDSTTRKQLMGARGATDTFWEYVGAHEISHQWWGHVIGWTSFREQWMSEGFAEFSASLYVQRMKGVGPFVEFWENQRKLITEASPSTKGRKPYTVGPITLGYRLNSGKTGNIARRMIYPKGAYVLHMIRMMMYNKNASDPDERFKTMMQDFIKSHYNQEASTEDFKKSVEKYMTNDMNLAGTGNMDWFFDQWVYGTEVPAYTFEYQIGSANGKPTLSGHITQSGVSENFRMLVPVWVDYGKGPVRLGSATLIGNSSVDLTNVPLPAQPKKVAICMLNDVLATSVQNTKR